MCARSPELYYSLWDTIRTQDKRQDKANQRSQNSLSSTRINAAAVDPKDVMGVMGSNVMNWNTVETVLLFCAILVTLGGIMLESGRFDQEGYQDQRDAITIILMLIIMSSITYYFTVFGLELYMLVTAKDRARRLQQASIKKVKEGKAARKIDVDMSNAEYSANPLMDVSKAGKDSGADGDSALLQNMRGMMELESLDRHSWVRLRGQFKEFVLSYEEMSKEYGRMTKENACGRRPAACSPLVGASSPACRVCWVPSARRVKFDGHEPHEPGHGSWGQEEGVRKGRSVEPLPGAAQQRPQPTPEEGVHEQGGVGCT